NEVWDFSLVDPDNRRPVDYKLRRQLLAEIRRRADGDREAFAAELLKTREDGRIKLFLTRARLSQRPECPRLVADGGYRALPAVGNRSGHVCAFARIGERGQTAIAVAPVLLAGLMRSSSEPVGEIWGNTKLIIPSRLGCRFENVLTGQELEVE